MTTTLHPAEMLAEWPLDEVAYLEERLLSLHLVHLGDRQFGPLDEAQVHGMSEDVPDYWAWYSTYLGAAAGRLDEAGVPWSAGHPSHRMLSLRVVNGESS